MNDGALSLGRWYRLAPRGGAGLSCDEAGVALGPAPLIDRMGSANGEARYATRQAIEIARAFGGAYRDMNEAEFRRCLAGLDRIVKAFNRGDRSLAAIMAVQLRLPEIDTLGMAKLTAATDSLKYDPDQPRVPAGNPAGSQWTSAGATQTVESDHFQNDRAGHDAPTLRRAKVIYGETAGLRPQLLNPKGNPNDPNNWDPKSTAELAKLLSLPNC